jgi:hypothetical protein
MTSVFIFSTITSRAYERDGNKYVKRIKESTRKRRFITNPK